MSEQISQNAISLMEVLKTSPYPPEAVEFIQEGLTYTVENLHGEMSSQLKKLYGWMNDAGRQIDHHELCRLYEEGSLPGNMRRIVEDLGGPEKINRHISGEDLCWGLRDLALKRWGQMARTVLRQWSITSTVDFGKIVFLLVEHHILQKQPDDKLADFEGVYDFGNVFDRGYEIPVRDLRRGG
jgi:uncharacterized repeat protein (TIGR04138 family)